MTDDEFTREAVHDAFEAAGQPVASATTLARELGVAQADAHEELGRLADEGALERLDVENDPTVWYPSDWLDLTDRERVVVFPRRRQVVVDQPTQFTRARLAQFAYLDATNRSGGYIYEIRPEDIWQAPYEDFDALLESMRAVLGDQPVIEDWVHDQWRRANVFRLYTHEEGYTVLEAGSPELMGNVAEQKLPEEVIRAPISDTEVWANEDETAKIKRILYEAGYPVKDERDLEEGDPLDVDLDLQLRPYQQDWVDRFVEQKSGVLVGPPGSGKTVAALGVLEAVGGETLVLVPSRELATQWRDEILTKTNLGHDDVGEYHGGTKEVRPITIATYRIAGMDRHRQLFDARRWGLIVYDEVHHVPSNVYRRSADLQTRHRLGLSATPVREDDREKDIYTLIGPPIGTDWNLLFDEGFVQEPEVEIRYVPWSDDDARAEYAKRDGHERRMAAAQNPAKVEEVRHLLRQHSDKKALVFVDYLDQGDEISEALDVPFISGETPHIERERLFDEFRRGARDTLVISRVGDEGIDLPDAEVAIAASGLGGSRRQGAQRAGRTMRPAGRALMFVLATRGTEEEDFARSQLRHLASKGVTVREADGESPTQD